MKKNKKRINTSKVVIIFSLILIVVIVLYTSLNSGIFNSDNIEIEGNKYVESEYIIKALEVNNNKNIFRYNIKDMEEILLNNKYIDKVEIKRLLPNTLKVSIIEKEKILEKCKEIKPDAITSVASDLATLTVNYLAEKLGLAGNSLECTKISTNKYEMRKAFQKYGVSVPKFFEISDVNDLSKIKEMKTPIIIKPTDRSGSRSITKIEDLSDEEKLKTAIRDAIEVSFEKKAIVEEYIDGDEFSAEGITYNGEHTILTITRKQTTGAPHFIETGHTEPAGLSNEMQEKVKKEVIAGLNSLKIENSASHAEFKITPEGKVKIIEFGARMGGDCIGSDLVQISTGYDFLKMVIDVALGNKPDFTKVTNPKQAVIKFIFTKSDVDELEKIKKEHPEYIYYISPIDEINSHKIIDSSTRYGYYILAI